MNPFHSALDVLRDKIFYSLPATSSFRQTGTLTPAEFVLAGDYLVYKFPTWSWADASSPRLRVNYLPEGKQFLVTRGVPSHRRLNDDFAGGAGGAADDLVRDGFLGGPDGDGDGDDGGWLRTGGSSEKEQERMRSEVQTMSESGQLGDARPDAGDDEESIPDMEDDDDDGEAIIREKGQGKGTTAPLRTYNLYITYTPYYRTPRFYLSGYASASEPLPPAAMMEDIVGDYKDKTVTLEDFPFYENSVKMASVHPCKHASVMKVLLERAEAAVRVRREKERAGKASGTSGLEGLVEDMALKDKDAKRGHVEGVRAAGGTGQGDEWEVLDQDEGGGEEKEVIRVDQYLVVFLKFMASITPGVEHDFTMGV